MLWQLCEWCTVCVTMHWVILGKQSLCAKIELTVSSSKSLMPCRIRLLLEDFSAVVVSLVNTSMLCPIYWCHISLFEVFFYFPLWRQHCAKLKKTLLKCLTAFSCSHLSLSICTLLHCLGQVFTLHVRFYFSLFSPASIVNIETANASCGEHN